MPVRVIHVSTAEVAYLAKLKGESVGGTAVSQGEFDKLPIRQLQKLAQNRALPRPSCIGDPDSRGERRLPTLYRQILSLEFKLDNHITIQYIDPNPVMRIQDIESELDGCAAGCPHPAVSKPGISLRGGDTPQHESGFITGLGYLDYTV